jgi:RNA polymerase sigma factor (sigma-70 family)
METESKPKNEFLSLIARVQKGDQEAARRLFDEYGPHLLRAVRRRLLPSLRPQFDSLDFAQDVWASFYRAALARYNFESPEQLVGLLCTMARHKVADVTRARSRQKRDLDRQDSLEETHGGSEQLPADAQTPSQILMDEEAWERLLNKQRPLTRKVLVRLRQGLSQEEIAEELGLNVRTVQRIVKRVLLS